MKMKQGKNDMHVKMLFWKVLKRKSSVIDCKEAHVKDSYVVDTMIKGNTCSVNE